MSTLLQILFKAIIHIEQKQKVTKSDLSEHVLLHYLSYSNCIVSSRNILPSLLVQAMLSNCLHLFCFLETVQCSVQCSVQCIVHCKV